MSTFNLEQPDYLQLTPTGSFPHPRGLQQVDTAALQALVKNFNSFLSRLGRRFAGIPFYIGHPDMPGYENIYPDRKAYGWIMELEAREDGLYGRPKWSQAGRELIENGHYKFLSPYWEAAHIGTQNNKPIVRPTRLISVGLTNDPNIPVLPLANNTELEFMPLVGMSLPLADDSDVTTSKQPGTRNQEPGTADVPASPVTILSDEHPDESQIPNSTTSRESRQTPDGHLISGGVGNAQSQMLGQSQTQNPKLKLPAQPDQSESASESESKIVNSESNIAAHAARPSPIADRPCEAPPSSPSRPSVEKPEIPPDLLHRLVTLENSLAQLGTRNTELGTAAANQSQIHARLDELETALSELKMKNEKLEISAQESATRLTTLENSNRESKIVNRELEVRLINTVLNHAVADLRILPHERAYWANELSVNFDTASSTLANTQPKLNTHTTARTATLPIITTPNISGPSRMNEILKLVNERMRTTGATYHRAWTEAKAEHPHLFV